MSRKITIDSLESAAKKATGLTDFGDDYYRVGLGKLVESLDRDGPLHEPGQEAMFQLLVVRLIGRLKQQSFFKQQPQVGKWSSDKAPIFVVGTIRSGTTLLYNLLALADQARCSQLWETLDPIPPASVSSIDDVNSRVAAIDELLRTYNENLPQLRPIHNFDSATQVEECNGLHEFSFTSPSIAYFLWGGPTYYEWLASLSDESLLPAYGEFLRLASALMHGHEDKHWLMKCPLFSPHVTQLATVFPNARFVHTHRNPRERIPSSCSLLYNFQAVYCAPDPKDVARQVLFYDTRAMEGIERGRQALNGSECFDIDYEDLASAPIETVERLSEWLGLTVSESHRDAMMQWLSDRNPYDPKKIGRHSYEASQFGLSEDELAKLHP